MPPSWRPFKHPRTKQDKNLTLLPQRLTFVGMQFEQQAIHAKMCLLQSVLEYAFHPLALLYVLLCPLHSRTHMFLCAHLLSLHLSLTLNPSQQPNSLHELASCMPTQRCNFNIFVKVCVFLLQFLFDMWSILILWPFSRYCLIRMKRRPERVQEWKAESISVCVLTRVQLSTFDTYSLMSVA